MTNSPGKSRRQTQRATTKAQTPQRKAQGRTTNGHQDMTDETTPTPPTTDEIKFWVERFIAAAMKGDDVETDAAITWAETTPERSDLFWRAFAERATDEKDSVIAALEAERERLEALSWSTSAPRPVHG